MAIIDEYIGRIDRCLSTPDIEEAGDLVEEIVATFIGPDPDIKKGLDRYKARAVALGSTPNFDNAGDLRKLKGKLSVLREKEAREATSDPARLALGTIDAHLAASSPPLATRNHRVPSLMTWYAYTKATSSI